MHQTQIEQPDSEILVLRYVENPTPDLKDMILVQYAGLVERTARKFAGMEPAEDLAQVGFIGLLNALSKFDPQAGVRFTTYATYLVAGEIKHYLRDRSQTIRQPAWLQELRHRVNKSVCIMRQELGREPSARELADNLGVSEQSVIDVFQTAEMLKVASLDTTVPGEEDGETDVERLDAAAFCPEQLSLEDRMVLESAMLQLRDVERSVLIYFHFDSMNQTEIADRLGISCNYVSHVLRQSLTKLRKILTSEEERDQHLRRQSDTLDQQVLDSETGAYTETYFRARLEEELHRASAIGSGLSLVVVSFQGLEQMQRYYGAQSVADFLADAAEFLKDNVRRMDVVCRRRKAGFSIILPDSGSNGEIVRARLLEKATAWTNMHMGPRSCVRMEIGVACSPRDGWTSKELIELAEPKPASHLQISAA